MTILSKRTFNKSLASALVAPFILPGVSSAHMNEPRGETVTFGAIVPQTGPYADEGADQFRGIELAIEHLNGGGDGGMLNTFSSNALGGNGVLGKRVEYVSGDTQTKSDAARASTRTMIEKDGAVMIIGGSSSGVVTAVQSMAQDAGIIFMAGVSHSDSVTGSNKQRNGFRHYFSSSLSNSVLAAGLSEVLGGDRRAYYLTADSRWGHEQQDTLGGNLVDHGWQTAGTQSTPLTTSDFSSFLSLFLNSGADVLVLNQYGGNMVNSVTQVVQSGLRDRSVNGKDVAVVVPVLTHQMARGAGSNIGGVYGTANWLWSDTSDPGTEAFVHSFGIKYGFPPSEAAHTVYCQTLLYADACTRAGSFRPSAVGEALEGFEWSGLGNGTSYYDASNHQAYMDVSLVQGKSHQDSEYDFFNLLSKKKPCPKKSNTAKCNRPDGYDVPFEAGFNDGY